MKEIIATQAAPGAIGPYSQAVKANGFLFASGQIPLVPGTGQLAKGGIREQTEQALLNLRAVLEAGGSNLGQVVKTTVFLKHISEFSAMNEVYAAFFPEACPARSAFEVASLPKDALVEIEAIALCE